MGKGVSDILRDYVLEQKQKNPYINETAVSRKMDIPPTTFNRLVNGHSKPAVKTLLKMSHFIPELRSLLPEDLMKVFEVSIKKKITSMLEKLLRACFLMKLFFSAGCWLF